MTRSATRSLIKIESLQVWNQIVQKIGEYKICGLNVDSTGSDPLTAEIDRIYLALPDSRIYQADMSDGMSDGGEKVLGDLTALAKDSQIEKVIHHAKFDLSFIRASQKRRLKFRNIFDIMLASQLCWSGFYELVPSNSTKNPWRKRTPDHSSEALAERHLGIVLSSGQAQDWSVPDIAAEQVKRAAEHASVLLPLHAILQQLIIKNGLQKVAELEFEPISPVVEMELSGIYLDADAARALIREKEARLVEAFLDIQEEAQKIGFIAASQDSKEPRKYLNPDCQEEVKRYMQSRCFNITSPSGRLLCTMQTVFKRLTHLNRFAIGDRDNLTYNADGSLDIYIQHNSPWCR